MSRAVRAPAVSSSSALALQRSAVVLVNIGTPDAPTPTAVRRYLAEFLADPRVLDMPALARFLLLHAVILRVRPRTSAALYRSIWTAEGSPLLVHTRALAAALEARLGVPTVVGMRYGTPNLREAIAELLSRGVERVVVVPLFPQYASATTGSALARVFELLGQLLGGVARVPQIATVAPYFLDDGWLESITSTIEESRRTFAADHVLLSYHGVPVRQVRAACSSAACGDEQGACCTPLSSSLAAVGAGDNSGCYRAQCVASSAAIGARLAGAPAVSTSFQSRFGRDRWIGPNTDDEVRRLARGGVRRLLIACPAFAADCLETLEEIGVGAVRAFLDAGGEEARVVPCLNAAPRWVEALAALVAPLLSPSERRAGLPIVDDDIAGPVRARESRPLPQ